MAQYLVCFVASLLSVWTLTREVAAQDTSSLTGGLEAAGYKAFVPPRTNWGPGFVFAGNVTDGKISKVEEICTNLYGQTLKPKNESVLLPNYKVDNRTTVSGLIEILKDIFKSKSLSIDGQIDQGASTEVSIKNAMEYSYPAQDIWIKNGVARPVEERCLMAINDLKAKGKFDGRVFVITRTVAAENIEYQVKDPGLALKLEGKLGNIAGVKISAIALPKGETRLELKRRMFIGYAPPYLLKEWLPQGKVSGPEIVKATGEATNFVID